MSNTKPQPQPQPDQTRCINLALQGGGSHGAFTWGVLDCLLEDGRLEFGGISGASAGAVNAVAVAHGLAIGARDGVDGRQLARNKLNSIWRSVMATGTVSSLSGNLGNVLSFWSLLPDPGRMLGNALMQFTSPYSMNPLDLNPLRALLGREIDFDAIRAHRNGPKLFISATEVSSGKAEIFTSKEITLSTVVASTCLPQVYQAVTIDDRAYWDGGYVANPPITPLIAQCRPADILLVQISPLTRAGVPTTPSAIMDRINEITFNTNLLSQMQMVSFINRLIDEGKLQEPEYRKVLFHRIDGGEMMHNFGAYSQGSTDTVMMQQLFDLGRSQAAVWLKKNFGALGVKSSVNIRRDYEDDNAVSMRC